jgi:hypothetical protein
VRGTGLPLEQSCSWHGGEVQGTWSHIAMNSPPLLAGRESFPSNCRVVPSSHNQAWLAAQTGASKAGSEAVHESKFRCLMRPQSQPHGPISVQPLMITTTAASHAPHQQAEKACVVAVIAVDTQRTEGEINPELQHRLGRAAGGDHQLPFAAQTDTHPLSR